MTIFYKIVQGDIPCHRIAENEDCLAFLDINPVARGHTLVIPKCGCDYIFDLKPETLAALTLFAQEVAQAMRKAIPCKRIGVAVIGLEVPHAHIHLVPISAESDLDFGKRRLQCSAAEFQQTADAIRQFL